jgi:hypothetical protein
MVYLCCFSILGGMLGFLLHAFIEVLILTMLIHSATGSFVGMTYDQWVIIHALGTSLLLMIGLLVGFLQGKYWWQELYVKSRHRW